LHELDQALALAAADVAVVVVLVLDDEETSRARDRIDGWAIGAKARTDAIGAHTVVLRTPAAPPVRIARDAMGDRIVEALADAARPHLTRDDERRLRPLAAAGDRQARQRLTDGYTELATALALWLRPDWMSPDEALRRAHRELDGLVAQHDERPLLVTLVQHLAK
jgi:hypothetical protein